MEGWISQMRPFGLALALAVGGVETPAFAQSVFDDVDECDLLAAHPADPQRVADGVPDEALISRLAVKACEAAAAQQPQDLRFAYQLGRAFAAANRKADARAQFERAARGNYAAAIAALADIRLDMAEPGRLTKKELDEAAAQHGRAAQGGFTASRQRQEALSFEPAAYTNAIVGQIVAGNLDGAREASREPATRAYLYSFVTNLMGQCGPVLDAGTVARFALYRFGGEISEEKENTPAVMLQPLVGEVDALRFIRRHGCEGQVPEALLFRPLKSFVERTVVASGTPEEIMLTILGSPGGPPPAQQSGTPSRPDGPLDVPLHNQEIAKVSWTEIAGKCVMRESAPCRKVGALVQSNQQVIKCQYGPVGTDHSLNKPLYKTYKFWYGRVPGDVRSYVVPGDDHPFFILGTRAVRECPKVLAQADALWQNSRLR